MFYIVKQWRRRKKVVEKMNFNSTKFNLRQSVKHGVIFQAYRNTMKHVSKEPIKSISSQAHHDNKKLLWWQSVWYLCSYNGLRFQNLTDYRIKHEETKCSVIKVFYTTCIVFACMVWIAWELPITQCFSCKLPPPPSKKKWK